MPTFWSKGSTLLTGRFIVYSPSALINQQKQALSQTQGTARIVLYIVVLEYEV